MAAAFRFPSRPRLLAHGPGRPYTLGRDPLIAEQLLDTLGRLQKALGDRYAVERELGRGGMATVFLAKDQKHDREVAIKVLHPELAASIGGERFEREIRLAAKLQHPHILGLYDSGHHEGLFYYVMPFVKGEALRDRLDREGQLPVDDAIRTALEVADALGYAHGQGIIHRDIKPENILLSGGHALVADFGIARAVSESGGQKLTQTGMAVGTPVYMSPEQATGEHVGPTADIYSLGCVLFEMLAGEPPFTGKNAQMIMAKHAMETVPSIRIVRNAVPEEVEEAIFAALGKVPADRPQSAAQFAEILGLPLGSTAARRVLGRTATRRVPTQAMAAMDRDTLSRPIWKRPAVLGVSGLALVGIAVTAWAIFKPSGGGPGGPGGPDARDIAVLYFEDPSGKLSDLADGLTSELIEQLRRVRDLNVVSLNGVAPFRNTEVAPDSIARVLGVGTLVAGEVEETRSGVRLNVRLLEGAGGTALDRQSFDFAGRDVLALRDSAASQIAIMLRERLGEEVRLSRGREGTRNERAWGLTHRAERLHQEAVRRARARDTSGVQRGLAEADSLLGVAETLDPRWGEPAVLRGMVAHDRALYGTNTTPSDVVALIDSGYARAERALALNKDDAGALELRGSLHLLRWDRGLEANPAAVRNRLAEAEKDLRRATELDGERASAWWRLAGVLFERNDLTGGTFATLRAHEADAYLTEADQILYKLYSSAYDAERFTDAVKWCDEGGRRFPVDAKFARCQLYLFTTSARAADPALAWQSLDRFRALLPERSRPLREREGQMLVAAALSRAGLKDSARRTLERARGDPSIDPDGLLVSVEAFIREQMGDRGEALRLIREYLTAHPEHRTLLAQSQSWWWKDLRNDPQFKAIVGSD